MLTDSEEQFIEEYKMLCKKYGMYLFAFQEEPVITIAGASLADEIIDEHVQGIRKESQHR